MTERTIWGVHMPRELGSAPVDEGFVAIGWSAMGNLSEVGGARDAFKVAYVKAYPTEKPGTVPVGAGVLYRFATEMIRSGDLVILLQSLTGW